MGQANDKKCKLDEYISVPLSIVVLNPETPL